MKQSKNPRPDDFEEHARERIPDLAERYGVSKKAISRWRKEIGLKLRHGRNPKETTEERANEINLCLNCKRKRCIGYCDKVGR